MKQTVLTRSGFLALLLGAALTLLGQYREYYVSGKVVDIARQPLAGVRISLREVTTSQSYDFKTNEKGEFKYVGLPHGIYKVQFSRDGFQTKEDEWNLEQPRDKMEKVEIPLVTLVTTEQVKQNLLNRELQGKLKEAMEKVQGEDIDGAIAILKEMLKLKEDDANARYLLGACYNRKELYFEALVELRRVLEVKPDFAGAHYQMGLAFQRLDQSSQALQAYDKALTFEANLVEALFNAGLVEFQLNQIDQAQARFEQVWKLRGDEIEVMEMLGRCHLAKGRFGEALKLFEAVFPRITDSEKQKVLRELIEQLKRMKDR